MPSETMRSDEVHSGSVLTAEDKATPLSEVPMPCVSVTVWNTTGRPIGIGGKDLKVADHLQPGASYTSRVRDLSKLFVFTGTVARVPFTYEV